jgi:hypothetical protein
VKDQETDNTEGEVVIVEVVVIAAGAWVDSGPVECAGEGKMPDNGSSICNPRREGT